MLADLPSDLVRGHVPLEGLDPSARRATPLLRSTAYSLQPNLGQTAAETPPETALQSDIKAQGIRLADVFLFGPLMVYSALGREPPGWAKAGLLAFGVMTIIYNARNYLEIERRRLGD